MRIVFMPRKPAAGLARSFNAQMMAARRGFSPAPPPASPRPHRRACRKAKAISLSTILHLKPANRSLRINSMTARRNRGCSNESGILSLRSTIRTQCMRALKTRRCSNRPMVVKPGTNFQDCAATARELSGNQAPAACACTRLFWIQRIEIESLLPSPRRVRFALTTAARPGNLLTKDYTRNTFRIRPRK